MLVGLRAGRHTSKIRMGVYLRQPEIWYSDAEGSPRFALTGPLSAKLEFEFELQLDSAS